MGVQPRKTWGYISISWYIRGFPNYKTCGAVPVLFVGISTKKTIPTMKYNEIYPLVNKHNYLKWPFIVDLPIKNGDFHSYVSLPEGSLVANQLSQPTESHISSLMDDLVGEFLGTPYCFCQTVTFMSSLWKYCCWTALKTLMNAFLGKWSAI